MALTGIGVSTFKQDGNSIWSLDAFGLDTLMIPMGGPFSQLATFKSSLIQWSPAIEDGNMFLATWTNDGHKQWPSVMLKYIGCRGGDLTRKTKNSSGRSFQSASFADSVLHIELSYLANFATITSITRTDAPIAPPSPSAAFEFYSGRAQVNGSDIGYSIAEMVAKFHPATINPTLIETLVPGQYYSNSSTGQIVLLPTT